MKTMKLNLLYIEKNTALQRILGADIVRYSTTYLNQIDFDANDTSFIIIRQTKPKRTHYCSQNKYKIINTLKKRKSFKYLKHYNIVFQYAVKYFKLEYGKY